MYEPLTKNTGVEAGKQFLSNFHVQPSLNAADGLTVTTKLDGSIFSDLQIPPGLFTWLQDLRLLRHVPIAYYVPDSALLPPESIRFFHVDATWMDRLIDGVFAAGNAGTTETLCNYTYAGMVRHALDQALGVNPSKDQMTGMLIRSELVRRWPDMVVRASKASADVPVLRAEPISKDLYIALFADEPDAVELHEPAVATRYGVEVDKNKAAKVRTRGTDGSSGGGTLTVQWRGNDSALRVLDLGSLPDSVKSQPRMVALHLEQRPYKQVFRKGVGEEKGSRSPAFYKNPDGTFQVIPLRDNRFPMQFDKLNSRYEQQQAAKLPKKNP